ncbi:B-cell receptor CD22-like [Puntigrus tetrazona]|uniref:B-cell receptor CD22-like n=1 Tax=Puntigrus tetrazona TaxID=1606681 RepID=UPI001C894785|nr:B-cell receptor CD22-like [Puntigrus tetrazona]
MSHLVSTDELSSATISVRMALLFFIFSVMIYGVSSDSDFEVEYSSSHICALMNSSVTIKCTYQKPDRHLIWKTFWTKGPIIKNAEPPDLSEDPEYSQRFKYLGDKKKNCTMRLSHVTQKDSHKYYFRFITDKPGGKWIGRSGVTLTVTDLQVESPERVTEGDSVRLTCKSSCALTDRATFIWYRNSQPLTERRDRNRLLLQSVRREDAGRYSCAVQERNHYLRSPDVQLNVTYPPRIVSVSISPSEIVEGDSVTLICSSDSNPPAEISWIKGGTTVGSGRIYNISKIRSDHSGEYKCRSRNEHGEKYSEAVTLNVMYPPRNVSVFMNGSGEVVEEDSVTLICSSDSNPPALNFFWFKENQSSSVGSGQSFSALQSGRFYCEAHNQHGSQRSDAVSVTVKERGKAVLYAAVAFATGCGVLLLIFILVLARKAKGSSSDVRQKQVQQASSSEDDGLYDRVTPNTPRADPAAGQATNITYSTVQHVAKIKTIYENIRVHHTDSAARSDTMEGTSVVYSRAK